MYRELSSIFKSGIRYYYIYTMFPLPFAVIAHNAYSRKISQGERDNSQCNDLKMREKIRRISASVLLNVLLQS